MAGGEADVLVWVAHHVRPRAELGDDRVEALPIAAGEYTISRARRQSRGVEREPVRPRELVPGERGLLPDGDVPTLVAHARWCVEGGGRGHA